MEVMGKLHYSMSEITKEGRFGSRQIQKEHFITIVSKIYFSVELEVLEITLNSQNVL